MKKNRFSIFFCLFAALLLLANLIIIGVFSNIEVKSTFYNALNVSSLTIAFVSFIASCFFSISVYLQAKNQNKINDSLPKKEDQYIIANYSLFNIEKEISFFSLVGDEKDNLIQSDNILKSEGERGTNDVTRLVFLPTDSVNMPTYKVLVKSIEFISSKNETLYAAKADRSIDGAYSANVLNRGYNCFCVDLSDTMETVRTLFEKSNYLKLNLDVVSVFNVKMTVSFYVYPGAIKNTDHNPDKKSIPDLTTYVVHHTNYRIEDKSILTNG